jgi:hypothetical protein
MEPQAFQLPSTHYHSPYTPTLRELNKLNEIFYRKQMKLLNARIVKPGVYDSATRHMNAEVARGAVCFRDRETLESALEQAEIDKEQFTTDATATALKEFSAKGGKSPSLTSSDASSRSSQRESGKTSRRSALSDLRRLAENHWRIDPPARSAKPSLKNASFFLRSEQ